MPHEVGTLAVDRWTVTFGTTRRGGVAACLTVPNVTAHPLTASVPITVMVRSSAVLTCAFKG